MKFPSDQQRAIRTLESKQRGLTPGMLFGRLKTLYILRYSFMIVALWVTMEIGQLWATLLIFGIMIGVTLADIGWMWGLVRGWAFTSKVLDWSKVEQYARGETPESADLSGQM